MGHVPGDGNLVVSSVTEFSSSAELGNMLHGLLNTSTKLLLRNLHFSPHPDPNVNSTTNQQRDDYPGLEPIEARLMDHNDLFVLDFGKIKLLKK